MDIHGATQIAGVPADGHVLLPLGPDCGTGGIGDYNGSGLLLDLKVVAVVIVTGIIIDPHPVVRPRGLTCGHIPGVVASVITSAAGDGSHLAGALVQMDIHGATQIAGVPADGHVLIPLSPDRRTGRLGDHNGTGLLLDLKVVAVITGTGIRSHVMDYPHTVVRPWRLVGGHVPEVVAAIVAGRGGDGSHLAAALIQIDRNITATVTRVPADGHVLIPLSPDGGAGRLSDGNEGGLLLSVSRKTDRRGTGDIRCIVADSDGAGLCALRQGRVKVDGYGFVTAR